LPARETCLPKNSLKNPGFCRASFTKKALKICQNLSLKKILDRFLKNPGFCRASLKMEMVLYHFPSKIRYVEVSKSGRHFLV
jgi:hypothetical protein